MKSIYKIAAVGILLVAAIAFISAKAFSAPKDSPIVIDTSVNVIDGFFAENIKDSTISDEGASYSGEQWLNSEGEVNHPQWFEGDKLIMADGSYYLIKAYPAPDYYYSGSGEFSDTIDIGNTESENGNLFEYVNASEPQVREVDGNTYTYRTLSKNGAMVLNLSCSPDSVNYLTVRLWGGDTGDTMLWVCDPVSGNMNETDSEQPHRNAGVVDRRDWVELNRVSSSPQYDGGFVYATYKIPQIYTNGKSSVSLRLYSTGGPSDYGSVLIKDQTEQSRGIYDVYMTQEAAFDPLDLGNADGGYVPDPDNLYDTSDSAAMEEQKESLKEAVLSGINALRQWQIFGDEAPEYMQGMITRADWRSNMPQSEDEWKNRYYNDSFMLRQNMTPLNMLYIAAYAYNNADELGLNEEERTEMLERAVVGIDFLCRAQGENGGFFSNAWIGGPERGNASGNNLTGFGLRYAGKCLLDIYDTLDESVLDEKIDSDADGEADISRREAWILMLEKARDYLIDINGGFGHAPNQDMANSIAALCFDKAIEKLGGRTLSKSGAGAVFDRCFGVSKNPLTSGYWVSPKGTILENFGSVQGGYSGDYGSNAVAEMSQLAEIAKAYYGYDYEAYMERVYDTIDKYYFTGKRLENGEFFAQEYTEGIISNRNAYYSGTERYPIDIYSALELGNDTALKIISNYITQKDISSLMSGGKELDVSNVHFEDSVIDAAHMYKYFDEITKAAQERNIAGYDFLMDDGDVSSYAWADEMARNVIIKDGDEKIYMALNWRNPAHSNKIYSPGEQEIMANDLCRVHASNGVYDSYGYAGMTTDGYETWTAVSGTDGCMEALMTVQYGQYTVIMNSYNCGSSGNVRDFKASDFEKDAGLDRGKSYMDMMTGAVYGYSGGYWHSGGNIMQVKSNSTLVLKTLDVHASRPVVSNGKAASVVTNNTDSTQSVVLYAAQYDESGAFIDVVSEECLAQPGITEIEIDAPNAQKAFIWDKNMKPLD